MKITIGYLFNDLLNLYGENGNVMALKNALESQDIQVEIRNLSLTNQPWILDDIDILYIGAGTEYNQILALNTLLKYKDEINQMIMNNKYILATGNSIELFGKSIKQQDKEIPALGTFDYIVERTDKRIVSECVFKYDEIEDKILGFENHQGVIIGISSPLFSVEKGFGSNMQSQVEGFRQNNFFGTYLIGPLLVRNPKLLEKLCRGIISNIDANFKFKEFDFEMEQKAHDKFLKKYDKD